MGPTDAPIVVLDAGPLIHLDELCCLDVLSDLDPLVAPEQVWREVQVHRPGLKTSSVPGLSIASDLLVPSARLSVSCDSLGLDAGETAALALAEQRTCRMFLTDDSAARLAAEFQGLRVHGTIGLIVRAIRRGLRSRSEVLEILASIPERSTLHLARALLDEVISSVADSPSKSPGMAE